MTNISDFTPDTVFSAKRNRNNTQERLIYAARQIIVEQGAGKVTVANVCQAASFTRGAFYSNYKEVNELIVQVLFNEFNELLKKFELAHNKLTADNYTLKQSVALLLEITPLDLSCVLLLQEVEMFITRNPNWFRKVGSKYGEFLTQLQKLILDMLTSAGRTPTVPIRAIADFMVSQITRSVMISFITHDTTKAHERSLEILPSALYCLSKPS